MTASELIAAQKKITDEIYRWAEENNLSKKDELYPITDGVADAEAYMSSNPKVMWVLKEPYDEFDGDQPGGGGWSIVDGCFAKIEQKPIALTWYNIIYVMYGLRNGQIGDRIPSINNDRTMANVLKEIAYINVSKMPNRTSTKDSDLWRFYVTWKDILWKQIDLYDPDIIIFGATFGLFQNDFNQNGGLRMVNDSGIWSWKNKLLLSAYHPQRKGKDYVDNLIDIINKFYHP